MIRKRDEEHRISKFDMQFWRSKKWKLKRTKEAKLNETQIAKQFAIVQQSWTIFLDSSMVEHPAVNRRVVGSSPTRGVSWWRCVYGKHPYPCRTRRLSHRRPMILGGGLPGKVGGCQLLNLRLKNLVLTLITRTERMRTAWYKKNVRPRDIIQS